MPDETNQKTTEAATSASDVSNSITDSIDGIASLPALIPAYIGIPVFLIGCTVLWILKRRAARKNRKNPFRIFVNRLTGPFFVLLALAVTKSSLALQNYYLPDPWNKHAAHGLTIAILISIGVIILRVIKASRVLILRRYDKDSADNVQARRIYTQIDVISKVLSFFIVVLTIAAISLTFEGAAIIGESLLASAGVAGIILGFAAQKTIGNLFAGIQIAVAQPIRIEDVVIVENEWGWIEEINLTYVVIRIWDLRRLVVPITYFTERPFQNWTRNQAEIMGAVVMHTDYSVPLEAIRKKMEEIITETPLWNGRVKVLQVIDCHERTIVLRALMTGKDAPTTWDLRCHVREKTIEWLAKEYPEALPRTRMEMEYQEGSLPGNKANGNAGHQQAFSV